MRFGVFGSAQPGASGGFDDYIDWCVEAEALGFESSFLVEHHFSGWNQVSTPLMVQACVAMRTTTLRLGTAVMVLPWHNPVLLAEQVATLDHLSGGRVDLGVGRGYRHTEFSGFTIDPAEAEARFDESLAVMVRAWGERQRLSHRGRFWSFDDVVVEPPPVQQPHPPLWVAAASDASVRRAAQRGFNLLLDQYASPQTIGNRIDAYHAARAADGHPPGSTQVAVARQVYVAETPAEAEEALAAAAAFTGHTVAVSRRPDAPIDGSHVLAYAGAAGATEAHALYGTPDMVCAGMAELAQVGVDYVLVTTVAPSAAQLARVARLVMPALA